MAELTASLETSPISIANSDFDQVSFRTAATGIAAADEFFVTGYTNVEAILSVVPVGTAAVGVSAVPNADGTGVTEGDDAGNIGVETTAAATGGVIVTALVTRLAIRPATSP